MQLQHTVLDLRQAIPKRAALTEEAELSIKCFYCFPFTPEHVEQRSCSEAQDFIISVQELPLGSFSSFTRAEAFAKAMPSVWTEVATGSAAPDGMQRLWTSRLWEI